MTGNFKQIAFSLILACGFHYEDNLLIEKCSSHILLEIFLWKKIKLFCWIPYDMLLKSIISVK